jgi:sterol desaturase/sphingolipid hydroxylase (fatty acid hydroxylase superfamily)
MQFNVLALAVPLFTGFMLLEYYLGMRKGADDLYSFDEAVANLNVGIAERLCDLFTTGLFFYFFSWIHAHFALFDIRSSWFTWVVLFLFTDFMWYWYHRFGHEVNLFWSVHVVHHQSIDYNFTVSARITVFQAAARCLFWSVLPLIGFDPAMIITLLLIHGAYPFFTHTQLVGKLGWMEYIFVTPSHHRVHHSSNPQYLDKNYGDVLIIWDRFFGTFTKETEEPVYGLTKPLRSHSFLWQHFHFVLEMAVACRRAGSMGDKCRIIFGKPDQIDPRIRDGLERKLLRRNRTVQSPHRSLKNYIRIQTFATLLLLFTVILLEHYIRPLHLFLLSAFIILSIITTGAMLEQRRWVFQLDYARICLLGFLAYTVFPSAYLFWFLLILLFMVLLFFRSISQRYYRILYS